MIDNTIEILVLGDYGPFSEQGKSIGYQVFINGDSYLVDLGAPLFQQIGGAGIGRINGAIITHCHDDHKRWFTDVALYFMYAPALRKRMKLITTDTVALEVKRSAGPSLNQSLDAASKLLVDIPYEDYVDHIPLGPRARYRIVHKDGLESGSCWHVIDADGQELGPERAKIVISSKTGKPRMLFRDPDINEWVEPESFYPFSSTVFYEADQRPLVGNGYTISIINAPVWHGLPNFGVVFESGGERLIFSSDTMHNLPLWQSLYQERRTLTLDLTSRSFLDATLLHGDINDYIERAWSQQRYEEAITSFSNAAVIHDITGRFGVVHTEYHHLPNTVLDPARTLLTHSPDQFCVKGWKLMRAGKRYRVQDNAFLERGHDDTLWPLDADLYLKSAGRFFAGYRHPEGRFYLYEKDGYHAVHDGPDTAKGEPLFRVNLFEDLNSIFLPHQGIEDQFYLVRPDGKVELVYRDADGSHGMLVGDLRGRRHAISPAELDQLGQRRADMPEYDQICNEVRELQRTLVAMREQLEQQAAGSQKQQQCAVAAAQAEITQLRQTVATLRDALEQERGTRDAAVREAMKAANGEILQLRETAVTLRKEMEQREVGAANLHVNVLSDAQQEIIQLHATVAGLRDQLDKLRKDYESSP
jgi:hypothetical protein